ncbi:MAG: hypothetical protein MHPDNHAH_01858 [Anaerolineales bacterium]|nr:hypothetical protein [Anaerolineales bacterium]
MTHNISAITLTIVFLLAACAPSITPLPTGEEQEVMEIPSPIPPTATATPLVVVSDAGFNIDALIRFADDTLDVSIDTQTQPYAQHGVIQAKDGSFWMYDSDSKSMVAMNVPEEWDVVTLSSSDDEKLQVELADGSKHWFDTDKGEWVAVEKIYTSGADDELQARVIAQAEETLGMSIQEKFAELRASGQELTSASNEETGMYRSWQMYLGHQTLSMTDVAGAYPSDRILIVFTHEESVKGVAYPYIAGYEYQGKFYQTSVVADFDAKPGTDARINMVDSFDELTKFWDEFGTVGDMFLVNMQTFAQNPDLTDEEWHENIGSNKSSSLGWATDAILKLIGLMDNDFMARMNDNNTAQESERLLDESLGDKGLFARSMHSKK